MLVIGAVSIYLSKASTNAANDSDVVTTKVIADNTVRFKGFRDSVPRWGLVVSSNDFAKISKCQMMENIDVVLLSHDQIEIIADSETLTLLFDEENINPSLPLYDSDTDLLIHNDTRSSDHEIDMDEEAEREGSQTSPVGRVQRRKRIRIEVAGKMLIAAAIIGSVFIIFMYVLQWTNIYSID